MNKAILFLSVAALMAAPALARQQFDFSKEKKVSLKHYRFPGDHGEESMWSAAYAAKSGKIYVGLCTHAEAAHLYEFDPATETMRHLVDLTVLHGERGEGINTNGKIHVRMGEDNDGNVYFGSLNEDTGPETIDPASYLGAFWYRYNPKLDKVEVLGKISRHFGLLGMVMDPKYMRLYGLAEDGHLYMHDIAGQYTRDLGKVDDWDICRTIFADDEGNVYGSYPVARVWKYDVKKDEVIDLPNLRLAIDNRVPPRTMSKPMIDRKSIWRVIEWDPVDKCAYGILGGTSMLFKYDVHKGPEGEIEYLTPLTAPMFWQESNFRRIPFASLALTIAPDHRLYFAPSGSGSFDYTGISWDVKDEEAFQAKLAGGYFPPVSYLMRYDIAKRSREALGFMFTESGDMIFGCAGACSGQKDGKIYFVGAVEEKDPAKTVSKVSYRWPYSMGLFAFDPAGSNAK